MYGKIFDSMYEGTLYGHWEAIVTLQQMLVLCNSEGVIDMTPQAIAARTSIPLDIIERGIKILSDPDPHSRTPGEDGRRICLLDSHRPWGWYLVNHAKYQKMTSREAKLSADRERIAEKRKHNKNNNVANSRKASQSVASVANVAHAATATDAPTNADAKNKVAPLPDWIDPEAWAGYVEMRKRIKKPMTERAAKLVVESLGRLKQAGNDPSAVLDQSTQNSWQGVFPIKVDRTAGVEAHNADVVRRMMERDVNET
jgi:hypothetical protein